MRTKLLIGITALIVVAGGVYVIMKVSAPEPKHKSIPAPEPEELEWPEEETIGATVEGRTIAAYTYADGETDTHLLLVGGIHGGYEWNTVTLAYRFMDYLEEQPNLLPENIKVTIIPVLNPDGLHTVVGSSGRFSRSSVPEFDQTKPGRFNANGVDLNRNFDCKWQPESTWQGRSVDAGTRPFSEPEADALRTYVQAHNLTAAVFWHSAANAVYASECHDGILSETRTLMNLYAHASGYRPEESFDAYAISGDAEGWFAKMGIPTVSVELATHETVEWGQNKAGVEAVFRHYAK